MEVWNRGELGRRLSQKENEWENVNKKYGTVETLNAGHILSASLCIERKKKPRGDRKKRPSCHKKEEKKGSKGLYVENLTFCWSAFNIASYPA